MNDVDRHRVLHDLNNQLVVVAGECELALLGPEARGSAELRRSLEQALAAARAAVSLSGALSRSEHGC